MSRIITRYFVYLSLVILFISACKKQESYLKDAASYADIPVFINNSILGDNLGKKLNGRPVESYGNVFLSGPGKFSFYNKNTGAILLEKEFNLQPKKRDTVYIFQPDSTIAPQLIKNTQLNEPAAPVGYMKLKIANLSKIALSNSAGVPYRKLDVIIKSTLTSVVTYLPIDTLIGIGGNLDTAGYYLVKKPIRAGLIQTQYKFSFIDHETQMPIQSSNGAVYLSLTLSVPHNPANPGKQVYTVYLTDMPRPNASAAYILKNSKYYDVTLNKLFE
ncbi:hypothetical protein [Pedobacter sp. UBA5917]|jgi:hypothetical protein|uniref:hypothetical protein n=1 Tax=Pedobacter sp. UBA5917 TaxID=1947061 RepID=UPI0025FC1DDF|nr:hypothetical protein [Pedobacter sp. UBA5917]